MGCMLAQQDSGSKKEKPIYYISKKMLEYEVKYTILEKTCLALVWATQRLRHYLLSSKILLLSRMDPLKYLFEKPALTGRTARWLLLLSKFDITYVTQKSVKGQVIAEQLADSPVEENTFLKAEFTDEEIMDVEEDTPNTRWTMYFDGAVNNQGQGVGAVLVSPEKEYIPISIKLQTKNHFDDALAALASMLDISATMEVQSLTVRLQWEPAHVNVIEMAARCSDGKPWYTDISNLISGEGHPPEASGKERRTLQRLAANFVICGGQLYRRSFDGIQLLCVDEDKAAELIEQTHEVSSLGVDAFWEDLVSSLGMDAFWEDLVSSLGVDTLRKNLVYNRLYLPDNHLSFPMISVVSYGLESLSDGLENLPSSELRSAVYYL
ncbi:uncharacterized protein LOC143855474 [Tasmannia lanceolata]|uniref:uncharacterized protein LOC143855474 n=1 Tax=Tasmannia lanceolata TaxID=3420 RepID=UPI0040628015